MTPVTPSASSRRSGARRRPSRRRARRPRRAPPAQRRRDERPVRHQRVDRALAERAAAPPGSRAAQVAGSRRTPGSGERSWRVVAPHARDRPAEAHLRRDARGSWRGSPAPSSRRASGRQPCSRSASTTRVLVAGQLEVDVELDAGVASARSARAPRRASPACAARRRRSRGRAAGRRVPSARSGRTSNSIMSTPASSAASKLASVLPGAMWSAPLWPMRWARLSAGIPGTSTSGGCRRPGRALRIGVAAARARAARAAVDGRRGPASRRTADSCIRGRSARTIAQHLVVADRRRRAATGRPAPQAALDLPQVPDARRPCAGRAARRRSAASGRRRAGGAGTRRSSNSRPRMSGPERRRAAGRSRVRDSVSSSSTGPSNCTTSRPAARSTSHARRGAAAPALARARTMPHEPVIRRCECSVRSPSKRRNRCLPCASTDVDRAAREPLGPAVAARSAGAACAISSGTRPCEDRADAVRRVVDRVALGHRSLRVRCRRCAPSSPASSAPSTSCPATTPRYLADADRASAVRGRADAVVRPGDAEEVAAVVAWCYEHDVRDRPARRRHGLRRRRGAARRRRRARARAPRPRALASTRCCGGWRPRPASRPRRSRGCARERPAASRPTRARPRQSQLGGNVATNAGGPHCFKHGVTRAWVTGLEAVVAPGEVVRVGGPLRKDVAGYDLRALLVGARARSASSRRSGCG